jgi:hypothetical protein
MKNWLKWLIAVLAFLILIFIAYYFIMNSERAIEKTKDNIKGVDCSGDVYNCDNFKFQKDAQSIYDKCFEEVGKDIHQLDNDGDGVVCESLA